MIYIYFSSFQFISTFGVLQNVVYKFFVTNRLNIPLLRRMDLINEVMMSSAGIVLIYARCFLIYARKIEINDQLMPAMLIIIYNRILFRSINDKIALVII